MVEQVGDILIFWEGSKSRLLYSFNGLVVIVVFEWIVILISF